MDPEHDGCVARSFTRRYLFRSAVDPGHRTRSRPLEKGGSDQCLHDGFARPQVETPESRRLRQRQPQPWHFQELAPHPVNELVKFTRAVMDGQHGVGGNQVERMRKQDVIRARCAKIARRFQRIKSRGPGGDVRIGQFCTVVGVLLHKCLAGVRTAASGPRSAGKTATRAGARGAAFLLVLKVFISIVSFSLVSLVRNSLDAEGR